MSTTLIEKKIALISGRHDRESRMRGDEMTSLAHDDRGALLAIAGDLLDELSNRKFKTAAAMGDMSRIQTHVSLAAEQLAATLTRIRLIQK